MSKPQFASANLTVGQINAIVKNLGGHERALRFLAGELVVKEKNDGPWHQNHDVIYTQIITDGTSGEGWYERLRAGGIEISRDGEAYQMLTHSTFISSRRMVVKVAILKGSLFEDGERKLGAIRAEAQKRNLFISRAELACYLREKFSSQTLKVMGLHSICVVHDPVELYPVKRPYVLSVECAGANGNINRLGSDTAEESREWSHDVGFAFVVSQEPAGFTDF